MDFIIKCLGWMNDSKSVLVKVKQIEERKYMDEINKSMKDMIWTQVGCTPPSQYVDKAGTRIVALYPGTATSYANAIHSFSKNSLDCM